MYNNGDREREWLEEAQYRQMNTNDGMEGNIAAASSSMRRGGGHTPQMTSSNISEMPMPSHRYSGSSTSYATPEMVYTPPSTSSIPPHAQYQPTAPTVATSSHHLAPQPPPPMKTPPSRTIKEAVDFLTNDAAFFKVVQDLLTKVRLPNGVVELTTENLTDTMRQMRDIMPNNKDLKVFCNALDIRYNKLPIYAEPGESHMISSLRRCHDEFSELLRTAVMLTQENEEENEMASVMASTVPTNPPPPSQSSMQNTGGGVYTNRGVVGGGNNMMMGGTVGGQSQKPQGVYRNPYGNNGNSVPQCVVTDSMQTRNYIPPTNTSTTRGINQQPTTINGGFHSGGGGEHYMNGGGGGESYAQSTMPFSGTSIATSSGYNDMTTHNKMMMTNPNNNDNNNHPPTMQPSNIPITNAGEQQQDTVLNVSMDDLEKMRFEQNNDENSVYSMVLSDTILSPTAAAAAAATKTATTSTPMIEYKNKNIQTEEVVEKFEINTSSNVQNNMEERGGGVVVPFTTQQQQRQQQQQTNTQEQTDETTTTTVPTIPFTPSNHSSQMIAHSQFSETACMNINTTNSTTSFQPKLIPGEKNVQVMAPETLKGGYMFEARIGDNVFMAIVPEKGVVKGEIFNSPMLDIDAESAHDPGGRTKLFVDMKSPRMRWRDGFFNCLSLGVFHPMFLNSVFCPQVALAQVMARLQLNEAGTRTTLLKSRMRLKTLQIFFPMMIVLHIVFFLVLIRGWISNAPTEFFIYSLSALGIVDVLLVLYFIVLIIRTRKALRREYYIPEGCCKGCEDIFAAICCTSCTLSQMGRHTADYETYVALCCTDTGLPHHVEVKLPSDGNYAEGEVVTF